MNRETIKFAQGEVCLWIEQDSSIMLKAISREGDPVELEAEIARKIGKALIGMAAKID